MREHDRIARFFAPLSDGEPGSFHLSDDAAMLTPPSGQQIIITSDSVIETIHVMAGATPEQFAQKLMRRNLSDLAAMGATPWRYLLNLHTLTGLSEHWFAAFSTTLAELQQQFGLTLIGGDSTSGAQHIHTTMTCIGLIDAAPLRRNGANIGDDLYVSGTIGDAAFALSLLQQNLAAGEALAARYHCPEPRLALGLALRGIATSCIDISDGLLADIAHITKASGVGAIIQRAAIPLSPILCAQVTDDIGAWRFALYGGDDYELGFTAPPHHRATIEALGKRLNLPLTRIGSMVAGGGVTLMGENGLPLPITQHGWQHD